MKRTNPFKVLDFFHKPQNGLGVDFPGHLPKRGARDVVVSFEALPIFLCQDVAEGIVGQAKSKLCSPFILRFK